MYCGWDVGGAGGGEAVEPTCGAGEEYNLRDTLLAVSKVFGPDLGCLFVISGRCCVVIYCDEVDIGRNDL